MKLLLPGILSGVALMLGAAIAYETFAPLDPVTVETPRLPARPAKSVTPAAYTPPPAEIFADIDGRPLFSATRQPLMDSTQRGAAAAATSDFVLVGVIMGSERAVALLRSKSTSATMSAVIGGMVNGWRVTRIDATSVTLRSAGGDFIVPLDGPANRPPSPPLDALQPAAAPQAAAPPAATPAPQTAVTPPLSTAPPVQPPAQTAAAVSPKPALPARPHDGTISPEALKGAPIDPATGQPTL